MAHRGRLNTLAHILNKPYTDIFEEFAGKAYDHGEDFDGDVKYHMGYSTDIVPIPGFPCTSHWRPTPRTSRRWTLWWRALPGRASTASTRRRRGGAHFGARRCGRGGTRRGV